MRKTWRLFAWHEWLIVECAIRRHESRGLHYTLDYPKLDDSRPAADTVVRRY